MTESVLVSPQIRSDEQVLAALNSTGAGFEAAGGSTLMLTEAVENAVDSIILARKAGIPTEGRIRVFIDRNMQTVEIVDDGLGFQNSRHIAEKPFESLKRYDSDLTGRFARGLQGFRAFCGRLTFITRRQEVPSGELLPHDAGHSGKTLRIEFRAERIQVELQAVNDGEFSRYSNSPTGAVAIYSEWKAGEFARLRTDALIMRLQHHFGELIRGGSFSIELADGEETMMIEPVDYTVYERIPLEPVPVRDQAGTSVIGEVVPELYLVDRRKRDRWLYPFLLYKNRPVGDNALGEMDEFASSACWLSPYITGFIRCDFCEINELRLALKTGYEREVLYSVISDLGEKLEVILKEHSRGLFDIRMRGQITDLVLELQDFLKGKEVFSFKKPAHSHQAQIRTEAFLPHISEGNPTGSMAQESTGADASVNGAPAPPITCTVNGNGPSFPLKEGVADPGKVSGFSERFNWFFDSRSIIGGSVSDGTATTTESGEFQVSEEETAFGIDDGEEGGHKRKRAKRRRPRAFPLVFQEDETNPELSWFDPATSTIVVNSGHPRYKQREGEELAKVKSLMDYVAELYIWEIVKLSAKGEETDPEGLWNRFLQTKFDFFEDRTTG